VKFTPVSLEAAKPEPSEAAPSPVPVKISSRRTGSDLAISSVSDMSNSATSDKCVISRRHKTWRQHIAYSGTEVHYIITSALSDERRARGVHTSVRQLEADIRTFIDRHNENPKPFKWAKSADQILASVKRFCRKTQQTLCGEL
jgi:hypothetical protein